MCNRWGPLCLVLDVWGTGSHMKQRMQKPAEAQNCKEETLALGLLGAVVIVAVVVANPLALLMDV